MVSLSVFSLPYIFQFSVGLFPNFFKNFSKLHVPNYHFLPPLKFLDEVPLSSVLTRVHFSGHCNLTYLLLFVQLYSLSEIHVEESVNCPLSVNLIFSNSVFANVVK